MDYIIIEKYRVLFNDHIEQALEYVKNLKEEDFKAKVCSNEGPSFSKSKTRILYCCF